MQRLSLKEIGRIINGDLITSDSSNVIEYLVTDSRTITNGHNSCFFALQTEQNDGHQFIEQAYEKGVRNFVVSKDLDTLHYKDCTFCKTADSLLALQNLAAWRRQQFKGTVIAITGSNGKTIVKEWLYQIMHKQFVISRSPKSYNSQIGVPLSVWGIDQTADLAIIEAGISMPGEMERLEAIIKPELVIVTNVGEAHQINFESYEQKALEKLCLAKNAAYLQYGNSQLIKSVLPQLNYASKVVEWDKNKIKINSKAYSTDIEIRFNTTRLDFTIPFTDAASIDNAINSAYMALYFGLSKEDLKDAMLNLEPIAMRLELKEGIHGCTLINDAYNSDVYGLRIALDFLIQQAKSSNQSKTVILSDVSQIESNVEKFYTDIIQLLEEKGVNRLIGVGDRISKYGASFDGTSMFYKSTSDLLKKMESLQFENESILIKGARKFSFEKLLPVLEVRTHKTRLEVNLQALIDNYKSFRLGHKPGVKIMAMVKAFAYGSGSFEVARLLQYHGCDYLAVAVTDEGVALREQGIKIPIMVLSPDLESIDRLISYDLEPEIYDIRQLYTLRHHLKSKGVSEFAIHLKVDTGMHRLGFNPSVMEKVWDVLLLDNSVKVASIFSHLAGADDVQFDDFTEKQVSIFSNLCIEAESILGYKVIKHILNSAGQERFPHYQFDMCRLGIGLYGVSAIANKALKPVASFKTNILQLRNVPANETVGYSRKGILSKDTTIATLPVGYADGLDRRLSNGVGGVSINGKMAPYVGNICMDLCMVDVTDIDTTAGDEVVIFGENPSVSRVAELIGTIPYEIISRIAQRVTRVYVTES